MGECKAGGERFMLLLILRSLTQEWARDRLGVISRNSQKPSMKTPARVQRLANLPSHERE